MKNYDLIIIGAGPAGIMAAITAAKNGSSVLIVEKNDRVGRKILATGNGRCNLTNKNITIDRYHGANPEFINTVLEQFTQKDTMELFENQGVLLKEEDRGRIFPRTNQASTIVEALEHVLGELGVQIKTGIEIKNVTKEGQIFTVKSDLEVFSANKVVLTTGGRAAHALGSSGDGIWWAKQLGHNTVPVFAALVPLETSEDWVKDIQGIKVFAKVVSYVDGKEMKTTEGDLLFTHYGVSGPAVMSHSGSLSPFVDEKKVALRIDLMPEISTEDLDKKLESAFRLNSKKTIKNILGGFLPVALANVVLEVSQVADKKAGELSRADRQKIITSIKGLDLSIKKVRPLKEAQVSRGGVDTTQVEAKTLESKIIPGLYFAGEVLDVDADSGGFNLQWAWASGFVAGKNA